MLSARELNSRSLPSRTWINEQLTFTHGYGLTLGPVNEVTPEGLPVLFIRDLPLRLDRRPEGDAAGDLLRRAAERPRLRQDQDRGVRLSARRRQRVRAPTRATAACRSANVFRRLMFAIRFRSTDTFFSPNLTPESRVMMYRRIAERVEPHRAVPRPTTAIRTWRSPTAAWSGCRTPTRRAAAIPTRAPPAG